MGEFNVASRWLAYCRELLFLANHTLAALSLTLPCACPFFSCSDRLRGNGDTIGHGNGDTIGDTKARETSSNNIVDSVHLHTDLENCGSEKLIATVPMVRASSIKIRK